MAYAVAWKSIIVRVPEVRSLSLINDRTASLVLLGLRYP